jgi:hypothetical protein
MMKSNLFKSVNDVIIGAALLIVGVFITFYDNIIKGTVSDSVGGYLVRPDVYVRMIGVLLAVCSLILILKAINFKRVAETEGFQFVMTKEVALTGLSLLLYAVLLDPVGFYITTFLLTMFLTLMYMRLERKGEGQGLVRRNVIVAAIYSVVMVIVIHLIFAKVLNVILPVGEIFY